MAVPQFIEFGSRIVNATRIVSLAPPTRTADGFEIEARVDGFSHKEIYRDDEEAERRYALLRAVLLDIPTARRPRGNDDPDRLEEMLSGYAES